MLKTFLIYLLLLVSGGLGLLYYLLNDKYKKQSTQMRILTKQLNGFTSQMNAVNKSVNNVTVFYGPIPFTNGQIIRSCSLHISPLSSSSVLRQVSSGTRVEILDSVEVQETLWYEVKLILQDDKNLKGYIRQEFIKGLTVVETNAVNRRYY